MSSAIEQARWAVVFEARPDPLRMDEYLGIAASLRPELERIPGFLENERFRSLERSGTLLSISLWESEAGIVCWRNLERHRLAQLAGRESLFQDYRLRVGPCTADTTAMLADNDDQAVCLTLLEGTAASNDTFPHVKGAHNGSLRHEVFEHLAVPARQLAVVAWPDGGSAASYLAGNRQGRVAGGLLVRIARDYGMRDRAEAPA